MKIDKVSYINYCYKHGSYYSNMKICPDCWRENANTKKENNES